jgi:apolipoprotein N-acyltransferase
MWQKFIPDKSQLVLAAISGLLMIAAFPKLDQGWLAWVALVPLLLALRQTDWRRGLVTGLVTGLVCNLGLMYWTVLTMHVYGQLPLFLSIGLLFLLAAYMALYVGAFGMAVPAICRLPWHLTVVAPALWVALELLRGRLFTGFPWELLGYSQHDALWVLQCADLFGVYGISALIVLVNAALALAVLHWLEKAWQAVMVLRSMAIRTGILTAGLLVAVCVYGIVRIHTIDTETAAADKITVAVVQGNIDQAHKWDPGFQLLTTAKYKNLSMQAAAGKPDLIVWPETATPFYFLHAPLLSRMVIEGIKEAGTHFIIGSPSVTRSGDSDTISYHNSAYLVGPNGDTLGKYDKVHLVPFGEYVPLKRFLPFLGKMVAQVGDFKPGRPGTTLPWADHPIGMLICYEVIFPELVGALVDNGARILVNITNDAWFDRTSAAYQHFSMAVFRAVENRRMLVRAANTGISGYIDPCGRIVSATGLFEDAVAAAPVALLQSTSWYSRRGDWPAALVVIVILAPWIVRGALWLRKHGWRKG